MLNPRYFVARRAVVLRQFRLDHNLGIEFIGDDEVGRLLESLDALGALGLPVADAVCVKHFLNRNFHGLPDNVAHGIAVPCEGSTEKAFIEQHGIRDTHIRKRDHALEPRTGVCLLKPMDQAHFYRVRAFR